MAPRSLYLGFLALAFSAVVTCSSSPAAATQADLICPTNNHEECYPRIFVPTEEFQTIKEGQDLPPGLHIRMNIYTGEKEARLNIPTAEDLALEAAASQEVIVVAQPEEESMEESQPENPALRDKFPKPPPAYEMVGKILPPRPSDDSSDSQSFSSALKTLKNLKEKLTTKDLDQNLDNALDILFDLSNDIYYGVEITKDPEILLTLFALMYSHDENPGATIRDLIFNFKGAGGTLAPEQDSPESILRRRQAAGILGHAIQNNPTALSELSGQGVAWMEYLCLLIEGETDPAPMKSKIKALSHLLKDKKLRQDFVDNYRSMPQRDDSAFVNSVSNGTQILLSTFLRQGTKWDGVRAQITELLLDNYVDEEMGAQLGLWPIWPRASDAEHCTKPGHELEDGCWEHHLEKLRRDLVRGGKGKEYRSLEKLFAAVKSGRKNRRTSRHGEL